MTMIEVEIEAVRLNLMALITVLGRFLTHLTDLTNLITPIPHVKHRPRSHGQKRPIQNHRDSTPIPLQNLGKRPYGPMPPKHIISLKMQKGQHSLPTTIPLDGQTNLILTQTNQFSLYLQTVEIQMHGTCHLTPIPIHPHVFRNHLTSSIVVHNPGTRSLKQHSLKDHILNSPNCLHAENTHPLTPIYALKQHGQKRRKQMYPQRDILTAIPAINLWIYKHPSSSRIDPLNTI